MFFAKSAQVVEKAIDELLRTAKRGQKSVQAIEKKRLQFERRTEKRADTDVWYPHPRAVQMVIKTKDLQIGQFV